MDLKTKIDIIEFRKEVQGFLSDRWYHLRENENIEAPGRDVFFKSASLLKDKGWLAPKWPREWGGSNMDPVRQYVLERELIAANFPAKDRIAVDLAGPVIYTFGTLEQKRRYLPRILSGEEIWCQGFSETEAGSDVNSLRTTAMKSGDHYIVNGHKIWTSNAHFADWMFALVRIKTESVRNLGLTFLLINMHDPRVSVRPIITIDGEHHVNQVTFDAVRVPVANVVGESGRGWQNARFLLANERTLLSQAPRTRRNLIRLKGFAERIRQGKASLMEDRVFRRKFYQIEIELRALEFAVLRVLYSERQDNIWDGLVSALKLRGSELRQRVSELATEALGDRGLVMENGRDGRDADARREGGEAFEEPETYIEINKKFLFDLSSTIAGGTSEIQRNIISSIALGL
jgi:alkylation response protein AidB-like acyl-CoA dehydrogenase